MVKHIVMWNFKEGFSPEENLENARKLKEELEALKDMIPGVLKSKVYIDPLIDRNRRIMLDSLFEDEAALENYRTHPEHVRVGELVNSLLTDRACMDCVE